MRYNSFFKVYFPQKILFKMQQFLFILVALTSSVKTKKKLHTAYEEAEKASIVSFLALNLTYSSQ